MGWRACRWRHRNAASAATPSAASAQGGTGTPLGDWIVVSDQASRPRAQSGERAAGPVDAVLARGRVLARAPPQDPQRGEAERQVQREDEAPCRGAEERQERAADHRAERGRHGRGGGPDPDGATAILPRVGLGDDGERAGHHQRGADALDRPRRDEQGRSGRQGHRHGGQDEQRDAGPRRRAPRRSGRRWSRPPGSAPRAAGGRRCGPRSPGTAWPRGPRGWRGRAMAVTEPSMNPMAEARMAAARIQGRASGAQKDGRWSTSAWVDESTCAMAIGDSPGRLR